MMFFVGFVVGVGVCIIAEGLAARWVINSLDKKDRLP